MQTVHAPSGMHAPCPRSVNAIAQQPLGTVLLGQMIYEALPEGTVQHGHALEGLQQHEQGVTLQFSGQPDVHADFVVAADGYFSPVREIVLDDGPPEFKVGVLAPKGPLACTPSGRLNGA